MQIEPHVGRNSEVVLDCAPTMHNRVLAQSERAFSPVRDLTHVSARCCSGGGLCRLPERRRRRSALIGAPTLQFHAPAAQGGTPKWPVGPPLSHLGIPYITSCWPRSQRSLLQM